MAYFNGGVPGSSMYAFGKRDYIPGEFDFCARIQITQRTPRFLVVGGGQYRELWRLEAICNNGNACAIEAKQWSWQVWQATYHSVPTAEHDEDER